MTNKGNFKDEKKKKRKEQQVNVFGNSANQKKIRKQKNHRYKKSHKKYDKGGRT